MATQDGEGWQPIETAPDRGRVLVGWSQREKGCEYVGQPDWNMRTASMLHGRVYLDGPTEGPAHPGFATHWMPLPKPPVVR